MLRRWQIEKSTLTGSPRSEYSWAVALALQGDSVRIEAAAAPASPTVEEHKQAEAWTAPVGSSESDEFDGFE
jgi:hypothetical protein